MISNESLWKEHSERRYRIVFEFDSVYLYRQSLTEYGELV